MKYGTTKDYVCGLEAVLPSGDIVQMGGKLVKDVCREYGISDATYYNWKSKYGGMSASDLKRMKEMERELGQYKRMYAELAHENCALKDAIDRKI